MKFSKHTTNDKENIISNDINLEKIIASIEKDLYTAAKSKIYNIDDVNDIMQETLFKIYANIDTLKDIKCLKSWAMKILLNECNKVFRQKYNDKLLHEKLENKFESQDIGCDITKCENDLCFYQLISILPNFDQNIFILRYKCNYSIKEITEILDSNENTIKSKLKRCKAKIESNCKKWRELI